MITKTVKGDLRTMIENTLAGRCPFPMNVIHGCNVHATQGSGIAGDFRAFPEIYQADLDFDANWKKEGYKPYQKIGHVAPADLGSDVVVFNAFTQVDFFPRDKRHANYAGIGIAFSTLNTHLSKQAEVRNKPRPTLFTPLIGAGLAGGDWEIIKQIIDDATPDIDVIVVEYVKGHEPRFVNVTNGSQS